MDWVNYEGFLDKLAPEFISPEQFADMKRARAKSGVHRIHLAAFELFLRDYEHPPIYKGSDVASYAGRVSEWRRGDNGRGWVESERDGAFTFVTTCDLFQLDVDVHRKALTEWMDKVDAGAVKTPLPRRSPVVEMGGPLHVVERG